MTAYTKAAKRRAKAEKRARTTLPGGEIAPARRGQGARHDRLEPPANATVLEARARMLHTTKDAAAAHMLTDDAGRAIWLETGRDKPTAEQAPLWGLMCDLSRSYATYCASIGTSPHAKCGKVEYLPERFEARADDRPDLRTREEKDRAAKAAWMRWNGSIGRMYSGEQSALWNGISLRGPLIRDGQITTSGKAFVKAMRTLRQIVG